MISSKKILLFFVSFCLILPSFAANNVFSVEQNDGPISIFFGNVLRLDDFDYYLIPEYINSEDYLNSEVNENLAAIRLELEKKSFDSKVSKNVFVAGHWDFESGCVDSLVCREGCDHFTGEFKDGFFYSLGKKYFPIFSSNSVFSGDFLWDSMGRIVGKVDLFGVRIDQMIIVYAVAERIETPTTFTGQIRKNDLNEFFFVKSEKNGRKITSSEYELFFDDESQIFEGRNRINISQIIPGRVSLCNGLIDNDSNSILVNSLVCNISQATDGGRILGVVKENNGETLKISCVVNQFVECELKTTFSQNTLIIHDGLILNYKELLKIPIDYPVEVIGIFGEYSNELNVDVITTDPKKSSDFVFGVWNEETESITDYFGDEHKSLIDDYSWIYSPGGAIEENTILLSWLTDGKAVGVYVPEFGIMGVRLTGWFTGYENGIIKLDCLGSMNYDLQGKKLDVDCRKGCKVIEGGFGFIDPETIEVGTLLHCWGIPDFSGNFDALMVSVH